MTVTELAEKTGFSALTIPCPDKEVKGAYVGDLLSWVMGRAEACNAWITIMSNVNVLAVASLADVACVILAEGVTLESELAMSAQEKSVNILSSPLPSYETALKLQEFV